jgi:hypothetical protein
VQVEHEVPTPEELEVAHAPLQLLTIPKPTVKSIQMKVEVLGELACGGH